MGKERKQEKGSFIKGSKRPFILTENAVKRKKRIPIVTLRELFSQNVVELKFVRRTPLPKGKLKVGHRSTTRRMLCTSNWRMISSPLTRHMYKWTKPKSRRGRAWYLKRNLIIVWDLFQNGFRMVSLDEYEIVGFTPVSELQERMAFSDFFKKNLWKMPKLQKDRFSDK